MRQMGARITGRSYTLRALILGVVICASGVGLSGYTVVRVAVSERVAAYVEREGSQSEAWVVTFSTATGQAVTAETERREFTGYPISPGDSINVLYSRRDPTEVLVVDILNLVLLPVILVVLGLFPLIYGFKQVRGRQ